MNKIEMVKGATLLVVTIGVGKIVGNIIVATTPPQVKLLTRVCITVGSFALGSMAGEAAADYAGRQIDAAVAGFNDMMGNLAKVES